MNPITNVSIEAELIRTKKLATSHNDISGPLPDADIVTTNKIREDAGTYNGYLKYEQPAKQLDAVLAAYRNNTRFFLDKLEHALPDDHYLPGEDLSITVSSSPNVIIAACSHIRHERSNSRDLFRILRSAEQTHDMLDLGNTIDWFYDYGEDPGELTRDEAIQFLETNLRD